MKKLFRYKWYILGFTLLLVTGWFYLLVVRVHRLEIREDTTFITGPLDAQGNVDYETALNAKLSQGIRPEENANVLLWQALGPTPDGGSRLHSDYWSALSMVEPPAEGKYLQNYRNWELSRKKVTDDSPELTEVNDRSFRFLFNEWYLEDEPIFKEWISSQAAPLELARQASLKPKFYNPVIARDSTTGERTLMIGAPVTNIQSIRSLATTFQLRAHFSIQAKNFDSAWADMLTLHRLAALLSHCGSLIERLVAVAIHNISSRMMIETVNSAKWSHATLQQKLAELQQVPKWHSFTDVLNNERYLLLSSFESIRLTGNLPKIGPKPKLSFLEQRRVMSLNWTKIYTQINEKINDIVRITNIEDHETQLLERYRWLDSLKKPGDADSNSSSKLSESIGLQSSESIEEYAQGAMKTYDALILTEHRREMFQHCILVAMALSEYRQEKGQFPTELTQLVPKFLQTIPRDPYLSNTPIRYLLTERGYILYPFGHNSKDDPDPAWLTVGTDNFGVIVPRPPASPKPSPIPEEPEN